MSLKVWFCPKLSQFMLFLEKYFNMTRIFRLQLFLAYLLLMSTIGFCEVRSITGDIIFDVQRDGQAEMTLTSTGLGIGILPSANLHVQGNALIAGTFTTGATTGYSTLDVHGSIAFSMGTFSAGSNTVSGHSVNLTDTSMGNITLNLPYAGNVSGRIYSIKKTSLSYDSTIYGGGNTIDSKIGFILTSGNMGFLKVVSNGAEWMVLEKSTTGVTPAPWTPAWFLTSPSLWLDASDATTIIATGGNVSQWNDKSGSGYHLVQPTGTRLPRTGSRTINGLNALDFDGINDRLQETSGVSFLNERVSIFAVCESDNVTLKKIIFTSFPANSIDGRAYLWAGANLITKMGGGTSSDITVSSYTSIGQKLNLSVSANLSQVNLRDNGTLLGTSGAYTQTQPSNKFVIGDDMFDSGFFDGAIAEVLFFQGFDLSDANREKIEGYLAHKWGLSGNLPSTHPYKNAAP